MAAASSLLTLLLLTALLKALLMRQDQLCGGLLLICHQLLKYCMRVDHVRVRVHLRKDVQQSTMQGI